MSLDVSLIGDIGIEIYSANITHNLNKMAMKLGVYKPIWRPEEIKITKARELIVPLQEGLYLLKKFPETYKDYNPENGWGDYNGLVDFMEGYLEACKNTPYANVKVCR